MEWRTSPEVDSLQCQSCNGAGIMAGAPGCHCLFSCLLQNVNGGDLNRLWRWALLPNSTSCLHTLTSAGSLMGKWLPSATRTGEWAVGPTSPTRGQLSTDSVQALGYRIMDLVLCGLCKLGHILSLVPFEFVCGNNDLTHHTRQK